MGKTLIITYYWPPSGGAGVQRWVKFVKYFNEQNMFISQYLHLLSFYDTRSFV